MDRILVGVDGSPTSQTALAFAAGEARAHDAELVVAHAYEVDVPVPLATAPSRSYVGDESDLAAQRMGTSRAVPGDEAERRLATRRREETHRRTGSWAEVAEAEARETVEAMLAELGDARPERVSIDLTRDVHAAEMLTRASEDADLLVVGSRGRGGFRGLLLGSVSQQCVHHARCPVVVIPAT